MEKIRVIHDTAGKTLTIWFDDPQKEHICEETTDEIVLMKDSSGRIIGFELLHYNPDLTDQRLSVETVVMSGA